MVWQKVKLNMILKQIKEKIQVENNKEYSQVTVSNTGEIKLREKKFGIDIGTKKQTIIKQGWFIYSRLGIHEGSFGIVPESLDGAIVTGDMPVFKIKEDLILPEFLLYCIKLPNFKFQLNDLTRGLAQTRVREKFFLDLEINIPDLQEQVKILSKIQTVENAYKSVKNNLIKNQDYIQSLRQSILSEAIQGKLVPQDSNDEPVLDLLKKIIEEKEKKIKEKKIKREKSFQPISVKEIPYKLPKGWTLVRLGDVSHIQMGQSPPGKSYNEKGDGIPLINGPVEFSKSPLGETQIRQFTNNPTKISQKGDLLVCVRGATTGRTNIASVESCIGRGVASIRSYIYQPFINWIMVYIGKELLDMGRGSTFPSISQNQLVSMVIGFPPLKEQKRIVEKVNHLWKLSDELEEKVRENQKNAELLMKTVLHEAFEN
jgi:type I restriction enzyme S subunit